jgi:hypothetical protein
MWRSMTCSMESFSWLALARLKLINNASSPGTNNLAFMRNLARFDSGITNLSPEMPNLAFTRARKNPALPGGGWIHGFRFQTNSEGPASVNSTARRTTALGISIRATSR